MAPDKLNPTIGNRKARPAEFVCTGLAAMPGWLRFQQKSGTQTHSATLFRVALALLKPNVHMCNSPSSNPLVKQGQPLG